MTAPLRRVINIDESGFYVQFHLECGHFIRLYPYKFKDHKPYPRRKRCHRCQYVEENLDRLPIEHQEVQEQLQHYAAERRRIEELGK